MKEKVGIALAIVFIACAMVCGFFLASMGYVKETPTEIVIENNDNTVGQDETSTEISFQEQASSYDNSEQADKNGNYDSVAQDGIIVYDVLMLNFNDAYFPENKTTYINKFQEVSDYFYSQSMGKITMKFNFYCGYYDANSETITKKYSSTYSYELSIYNSAMKNATFYFEQSSGLTADYKVLYLATNSNSHSTFESSMIGWAHVWWNYGQTIITTIMNCESSAVIAHEFGHTIGIEDAYSNVVSNCVEGEIMGNNITLSNPFSAYIREQYGWLKNSEYDDEITTSIETISQDGRYRVYYPMNQTETIAFKFGEKDGQAFYIEARKTTSSGNALIVNRSNNAYFSQSSLNAKADRTYLYTTGIIDKNNLIISPTGTLTTTTKSVIKYAYETKPVEVTIGNVVFYEDYVEFDFINGSTLNTSATIKIIDENNCTVSNANIYVNDVYFGKTNESGQIESISIQQNDKIKIEKENYQTIIYTVTSEIFNIEKTYLTLTINKDVVTQYKIKIIGIVPNDNGYSQSVEYNLPLSYFDISTSSNSMNNNEITLYDGDSLSIKPTQLRIYNDASYKFMANSAFTYIFDASQQVLCFTYQPTSENLKVYAHENTFTFKFYIPQITYEIVFNDIEEEISGVTINSVLCYNPITTQWINADKIYNMNSFSYFITTSSLNSQLKFEFYYNNQLKTITLTTNLTTYRYYVDIKETYNDNSMTKDEENLFDIIGNWFSNIWKTLFNS